MYRECGARLRASMKDKGVDALMLLGNGNVVYATGASWPLLDAGLSHVERPVAVVLADDEHPHLYMPFREGSAFDSELPDRPRSRSALPRIRRGGRTFRLGARRPDPAGATVAVDELTGAMRRAAEPAVPGGPTVGCRAGGRPGQAGQDGRPDLVHPQGVPHHRSRPSSTCRSRWRPACGRSICRPHSCGAHSNSVPPRTCSRPSGR